MTRVRSDSPWLESDLVRGPGLGFEPPDVRGFIRCIVHGYPTPLARWHFHDEYELQLIVSSSGRAYVGDYIGDFYPGHLVLTGPRLPHNWVSAAPAADMPHAQPDRLVIQFQAEPLRQGAEAFGELADLQPLLDRASHGIEFFGMSEPAQARFHRIHCSRGSRRLAEFMQLLSELAACRDYRLLSTVPAQCRDDDTSMEGLNKVVDYVSAHYREPFDMQAVYALMGMSQSAFSRAFQRATGGTFTDFVNRYRVGKACEALLHSDRPIAQIAFESGFNNLANFNRRFAQVRGMTPSDFRREGAGRLGRAASPAIMLTRRRGLTAGGETPPSLTV